MQLVNGFELRRAIHKLKTASILSLEERELLVTRLVAMGRPAIGSLLRCLSHAEARGPALQALGKLLNDQSLGDFVAALTSPNPVTVSGSSKVMAGSDTFDASLLLDHLVEAKVPRSALEPILIEQAPRISPRQIVAHLAAIGPEVRPLLWRLLERCADPAVVPELLRMTSHEDPWTRLQAVKLAASAAGQAAVQALIARLADDNKHVRLAAVTGLHRIGDTVAGPALAQSLRDPDLKVQSAAIDALSALGNESTVPSLLEILKDESEHARRGAVEVLNAVATTQAIQDLLRALRDADWWVRVRAADALGSLGGEKVVDAVVRLLADEDEFVRRYAVEILNTVPSERAVLPLLEALVDPDWWVRERSIDALGNIGDARAVAPLLELMQREPQATPLCARSLGQIGDPRSIEPLCALLNSEREDVRREARGALAHLSRQPLGAEEKKRVLAALGSGARAGTPAPGRSSRGEEAHVATSPPTTPLPVTPQETRRDHTTQLPSAKPAAVTMNIADLRPGFVLLDRYRIIEKIGHGGFGAVYLVEDIAIQEDVILKVLNPMLSEDEKQLQRFIQELKLTRRITHKNVIRIFDFLDLGGAHAVSMEYCPGRDLGHLLDDEGPMEASRILRLILQVSAGLAAAHDAGVVHRDIKPSNILIGAADQVKIVDFGLAWAHARVGSRLTRSGLLIGTPEYMAPELIQGDVADHRADIYSVGVMMYEMLSGKKPYASDNPVRILFQHLEGDLVPLRDLVPGLAPEVGELVERCMARDPGGRPADVRALGVLADRALQHGTQAGCESHG